ncbi:MAG: beta-N-acetylhexosaminidase [Ruminococcaceae bacterium]|nr:beta-N-acetylhexosaminidase [Oscillospiraceae bacterium]
MKNFNTFGIMIDCSRNAVMKPDELKKFIAIIAKMGYNQVQLYMEETYEVDNEEYFGYLRGRYTQEELKELDDYCYGLGVELVPCIQTLAHMNAAVRWPKYASITDIDDILLVDDERTYNLIENIMSTLRKCFRTDKIHIGMDEAHNLGKGRFLDRNGLQNRTDILLRHLKRVCELTKKYDFKPMMWSDMFYRLASGGAYYGKIKNFSPEIKAMIPEELTLVYWDYYHADKKTYTDMIKGHKSLTNKVMFAGGAWKWSGFAPHNEFSLRTTKAAISACIDSGIKDAFITCWGDNGAETSMYAILPSLCYAACLANGINLMTDIKEKFKEWTGYNFDDFMLLDLPDKLIKTKGIVNPSKYGLYNDCFMGIFDTTVSDKDSKKYASFARKLKNAACRTGEFSYLFDTLSKLCSVMQYKVDIGVRTRKAYETKDMNTIDALIADYKKMIKRTEDFYKTFKIQWYRENKPHGFDVQDIRLGGLIMRMKSCMERLIELRDGKIDRIPELEEKILTFRADKADFNNWIKTASANVI